MQQETPNTPTNATLRRKRRISPFWLLPFIALLIAGWLIYSTMQERGDTVIIDFQSAAARRYAIKALKLERYKR